MDERRFEAFYRQTAGGLWAYVYRLTSDPAAADDIVQNTFFRFLRANPALTTDEHMRRYVYRAATNLAIDHFREKKRDFGRPLQRETPPASGADLKQDMARVFAELKPRERALLWLAHVEESNHDEIGDALGLKSKSVRVLLFRARNKLRDLLTRRGIR